MDNAPTPCIVKPETKNEEINNLELKEKKEFQIEFKNIIYDIILSKTMNNENIVIQCYQKDNKYNIYETILNFDDLIKLSKAFKVCESIDDGYKIILNKFNEKKIFIEESKDFKIKILYFSLENIITGEEQIIKIIIKITNKDSLLMNEFGEKFENLVENMKKFTNENNMIIKELNNYKNEITIMEKKIKKFEEDMNCIQKENENFKKEIELLKSYYLKDNKNINNDYNTPSTKENEHSETLINEKEEAISLGFQLKNNKTDKEVYFENEINSLKEELNKINNDKKNLITKKDFDLIKEDLNDLNEKYSELERVFENKLDFFESSLSKSLKQDKNNKEEKKVENKNEINIINNNINNNNNNIINNEDEGIWKEFINILDEIFSAKNENSPDINKNTLKKFEKISLNLLKKEKFPIDKFNNYFSNKIGKKAQENMNLIHKKNKIFETLNDLQDNLLNEKEKEQKKGSFLGFHWNKDKKEKKVEKKVNVENFDIKKFREEYNLSKEEFSDDFLKNKYIECKGNEENLFEKIIVVEK